MSFTDRLAKWLGLVPPQPCPNLALVVPGVWRGGQPTKEGWAMLARLGVRQSLKLNPVSEAYDEWAPANAIAVKVYPISLWEQEVPGQLSPQKVSDAVNDITPGTYIHCEHGQDRTGLIVAMYRLRRCNWTKASAEAEMLAHGFHKVLFGLWEFWQNSSY